MYGVGPDMEGYGLNEEEMVVSENTKRQRETLQFTQDLIDGKLDPQIEEQKKAEAKQAEKEAREQGKFGTKRGSAERDAEYKRRVEARKAGQLPEQIAKQDEVQRRIDERNRGYADRRLQRQRERSGTQAPDTSSQAYNQIQVSGYGTVHTGQGSNPQKPVLTTDINMMPSGAEISRLITGGSSFSSAQDVFQNTADDIAKINSPQAKRWASNYNEAKTLYDRLGNDQQYMSQFTSSELKQARANAARTMSGLLRDSVQFGDIGMQVLEQDQDEAERVRREQQAEARRNANAHKSDIASVVTAVRTRSEKQRREGGEEFTDEEFQAAVVDEYNKRQIAGQVIEDMLSDPTGAPESQSELAGPASFDNNKGSLIPYTEGNEVRMRVSGAPGVSVGTTIRNGKMYAAPRNKRQVDLLPKGTFYIDPGSNTLGQKTSGPSVPADIALKEHNKSQSELVEETQRAYFGAEKEYKEMLAQREKDILKVMEGTPGLTREQILNGDYTPAMLEMEPILGTLTSPMPLADTPEGEKQIQRMMQDRIAATRRAQQVAKQESIKQNAERAPYYNTQNSFDTVFEDGNVLLEDDYGNTFDAYVIQSPESDFYGMPVPILDDNTDLERSQGLLGNAYYNPVAGKVIVPVFPQGVANGDRPTRAQFEELERMTDNAFPGLLETQEDKMNVLRRVLVRAGYATR